MKRPKKNLLLPLEWPSFLPTRCDRCDNLYEPRFSLTIGSCRLGRFLRTSALWMPLIALPLWLPVRIRPLHFLMAIFLPSIMLFILAHLLPKKARLHCHNCRKTEYFNPPESWHHKLTDFSDEPSSTPPNPF